MLRLRSLTIVAPVLLLAATSIEQTGAPARAVLTAPDPAQQTGKQIFDAVCAQCHSVQPPANLAPPMSHVARHYLMEITDADQAAARIAAWVREPAADRSLLDEHAIDMWGVMPPVELGEDQARAVADYVITLADSAIGGMMGRGGMMRGMGMGRGMMGRDTTAMGQGMMRGMGMGHGMMGRDTTAMGQGMMRGMGMGRGMMGRDTTVTGQSMMRGMGMRRGMMGTDTLAMPRRYRGG